MKFVCVFFFSFQEISLQDIHEIQDHRFQQRNVEKYHSASSKHERGKYFSVFEV